LAELYNVKLVLPKLTKDRHVVWKA